jgi:hypothetical protein
MNLPQREQETREEKKLYVGYGDATLVAINPTKDELMDLLGIDNPEVAEKFRDPEYTGETKDGDLYFRLSFYLKNSKTGMVDPVTFQITNKERVSKEDKPEWVNQLGENNWANTEADLWDNFKAFTNVTSWRGLDGTITEKYVTGAKPEQIEIIAPKVFRKALEGESNFYNFIRNMYYLDFKNTDLSILLDIPTLLKGNFKNTIKSLMDARFTAKGDENTVIACYSVKIKEDTGKEYQVVSNKFFLPGYLLKAVKTYSIDSTKLEMLKSKKEVKNKLTNVESFFVDTMDEENGIRKNSHYLPQEIDIYDSSKNFLASGAVVSNTTSDEY